jgi:tRNA-splicing ligase RtcB
MEVEGNDPNDLSATAAAAVADLMVEPATVPLAVEYRVTLTAPALDLCSARLLVVRAASRSGGAEKAGVADKDLDEVVDVVHRLDIARKVVSLRPIGNIKG